MFANDTMAQTAPADAIAFEAAEARAGFLRRTYTHLTGAVAGFVLLEAILLQLPGIDRFVSSMTGGFGWLLVLGAFMGVSYIADRWANSAVSLSKQYMGLTLYVVAEAVIFLPILYVATVYFPNQNLLTNAAILTVGSFIGITAVVFMTGMDFSFLGAVLKYGGLVAMGFIVCSILFSFSLGLLFSSIMVLFAGAACLYNTSNVMHHYRNTQHVAASLSLFASIALLFFYILRILMAFARDD